ncbi:G2/mitotic-specific cyclin [Salix suchowensis]|nr:G2/mitotic-specific cyclin [Salix suchowensis]
MLDSSCYTGNKNYNYEGERECQCPPDANILQSETCHQYYYGRARPHHCSLSCQNCHRGAEENAAVKRKREALLEVNANANSKVKGAAVGKGKEKVEDVKAVVRQPLRTVSGARHVAKSRSISNKPEEEVKPAVSVKDERAMAVDGPMMARRVAHTRASTSAAAQRNHAHRRVNLKREEDDDDETIEYQKRGGHHRRHPKTSQPLRKTSNWIPSQSRCSEDCRGSGTHRGRPRGDQWDDLDADDGDDPLMVSEYVLEIFDYLKEVEQTTMPNPDYMHSQKELSWKMRGILTDWLVQVHVRFRLLPETLFLCVNLIDRFLSARVVSLNKLQLVGVACMFIAAKFEEIVSPSVSHFLHCADSSYTEAEILQAERYILKTLDYNLSYPNPVHFLRRANIYWRSASLNGDWSPAPVIDGRRCYLVSKISTWVRAMESALVPTANLMLNYILKTTDHESFHKKYASKRFLKSSVYMREWALEKWQENCRVNLKEELPALKEQIREARLEAVALEGSTK